MPRFANSVEIAGPITAAVGSGVTTASLACVAPTTISEKITKITFGITNTVPASSTNYTVGLSRLTTNGTTPAGSVFNPLDPLSSTDQGGSTNFTTSWATKPTSPASTSTSYLYRWSFNAQGYVIDFLDYPEELWCQNNNNLLFSLLDVNLPSGTSLSIAVEILQ